MQFSDWEVTGSAPDHDNWLRWLPTRLDLTAVEPTLDAAPAVAGAVLIDDLLLILGFSE